MKHHDAAAAPRASGRYSELPKSRLKRLKWGRCVFPIGICSLSAAKAPIVGPILPNVAQIGYLIGASNVPVVTAVFEIPGLLPYDCLLYAGCPGACLLYFWPEAEGNLRTFVLRTADCLSIYWRKKKQNLHATSNVGIVEVSTNNSERTSRHSPAMPKTLVGSKYCVALHERSIQAELVILSLFHSPTAILNSIVDVLK